MRTLRLLILLGGMLLSVGWVHAQSGGQFCVRAFEDTNANGRLDEGESLLTRGISVNLLDSSNVTIASALLDQSPTAQQGVVCFQFLPPGQYTIQISSAEFSATTPASITTVIADDGRPEVVEFGGQRIQPLTPTTAPAGTAVSSEQDQLIRIVVSAIATLVVIVGMVILGSLLYWFLFGRRPAPAPDVRRTTGSVPAVRSSDTGKTPRVQ
ncbi:MAG: hypothetical protein JNM70_07110 [Anaerolineae bacterium]|nr:hypothetical protein [Anaerolineae bacterium]